MINDKVRSDAEGRVGGNQLLHGCFLNDQGGGGCRDACPDFGGRDVPDVHGGVRLGGVAQLAVGCDEGRFLDLGTGEVQAVIDRMIDLDGNGRGMGDEICGWAQHDDIGQTSELLDIGLCVRYLLASSLLPSHVGGLDQYEIRSVPHNSVGKKLPGLDCALFGEQPLRSDAGVDD